VFSPSPYGDDDSYCFVREKLLGCIDGRNKVTVTRNDNSRVIGILESETEKMHGNIDVGFLLLKSVVCLAAFSARASCWAEVAKNEFDATGTQSCDENLVPPNFVRIPVGVGRKEINGLDRIALSREAGCELRVIEPLVLGIWFRAVRLCRVKCVIEIEPINKKDVSTHWLSRKKNPSPQGLGANETRGLTGTILIRYQSYEFNARPF